MNTLQENITQYVNAVTEVCASYAPAEKDVKEKTLEYFFIYKVQAEMDALKRILERVQQGKKLTPTQLVRAHLHLLSYYNVCDLMDTACSIQSAEEPETDEEENLYGIYGGLFGLNILGRQKLSELGYTLLQAYTDSLGKA